MTDIPTAMKIYDIQPVIQRSQDQKTEARLRLLNQVLAELRKRDLEAETVERINAHLQRLDLIEKPLTQNTISRTQSAILRLVERELGLVPRNYYRNIWMSVGMAVFGIPFGVLFGLALHNLSFMAIGFPLGLAIGIAVGTAKDQIALREGCQMDVELR